jgi:hypothetical protein
LLQHRHGGKVAAGALALTAAIIYTYYESGRSKTIVEEGLNNRMTIEPYEVNEIRFLNNLTPAVYEALSIACLNQFASSPSSSEQGRTTTTLIISGPPHPATETSHYKKHCIPRATAFLQCDYVSELVCSQQQLTCTRAE